MGFDLEEKESRIAIKIESPSPSDEEAEREKVMEVLRPDGEVPQKKTKRPYVRKKPHVKSEKQAAVAKLNFQKMIDNNRQRKEDAVLVNQLRAAGKWNPALLKTTSEIVQRIETVAAANYVDASDILDIGRYKKNMQPREALTPAQARNLKKRQLFGGR